LDGGDDLVNDFGSARVGKVGNTFDELGHGSSCGSRFEIEQGNYKAIAHLFSQAYNAQSNIEGRKRCNLQFSTY
jgi:hypothetical protein